MTAFDLEIVKNPGPTYTFPVSDRTACTTGHTTTIKPGEPVKQCPDETTMTLARFVTKIADGDPELGTDVFMGIAYKESTETSTADGEVELTLIMPGSVIRGKATTASNMTAANLLLYYHKNVCFDVSSDVFTIDENEDSDPNVHGLMILAGDVDHDTLDVIPNLMCTIHAPYM